VCTRRWRNAGACKRDQSWAWRLPSLGFGTVQSRKYPVAVLDAIRVVLLLFEGQSLFSMQRDFSLEILFSAFQTLTCKKARQRNDGHGEACRGWAIVRCTFKFNLYSTSTNHRCVVSHPLSGMSSNRGSLANEFTFRRSNRRWGLLRPPSPLRLEF